MAGTGSRPSLEGALQDIAVSPQAPAVPAFLFRLDEQPDVMAHSFHPNTHKSEAGVSL